MLAGMIEVNVCVQERQDSFVLAGQFTIVLYQVCHPRPLVLNSLLELICKNNSWRQERPGDELELQEKVF